MATERETSAPSTRLDREFVYALDHFLRVRGWTIHALVERSRDPSVETGPIHPHQVTKWRAGRVYPSTESVLTVCRLFGVSRSFFYFIGEKLVELAELEQDSVEAELRVVQQAIANLDDPAHLDLLAEIETAAARQKARLAKSAT